MLRPRASWTRERRKWLRLTGSAIDEKPRSFRFRTTLEEAGRVRRILLRYGFAVSQPRRVAADAWRIEATIPETLSRDRLIRFCNLIDRTPSLAIMAHINVRLFRWLGMDRRQPDAFYRLRNVRY